MRSPILHALFGGGEWEVLMLEAVLPDGRGLTQRRSLLEPPEQQGEGHSRGMCTSWDSVLRCDSMEGATVGLFR